MVARRGRSSLGCLVVLLVLIAAVYFAFPVGEAYWKDYRLRDRMQREVDFAHLRTDAEIRARLVAFTDSLGLPPEARRVRLIRTQRRIRIGITYSQEFHLPFVTREVVFAPLVERQF